MLKKLVVKNFQCHQEQEFELDSGVNVFVGKSGAGKSAGVVRPLKWLVFNRPLGDSFRKWDSNTTWVEVQLAEGANIARKKSDKENCYEMLEGVKDMQYFSSFGQTPPESVQSALNLSQINFQFQHDPLYLLSYSPPEVARVLNELTGMDKIDQAFSRINSRLRKEAQEVATSKDIKAKTEQNLNSYKDLDAFEARVAVAEELDERAQSVYMCASSLKSLSARIYNAEERIKLFGGLGNLSRTQSKIEEKFTQFRDTSRRRTELLVLAETISVKTAQIHTLKQLFKIGVRLENLQAGKIKAEELEKQADAIEMLATRRWSLGVQIGEMETVLEDLHRQFEELMPDQCPLCGRSK